MKIGRKNQLFSIKNLLLLIIPVIILFMCFYINQDLKEEDKWISISELNDSSTFQDLDTGYVYCNSYDNIKNEKLESITLVLSFSCIIISLVICLVLLLKKIDEEKNKKFIVAPFNKNEKINEIISKFSNDKNELNVQQILNDDFKNNIYNMFCNLQIACMNSDYKSLQTLLTRELYNKYCTGLATLKYKSRKNIVQDFELISVKFIDTEEDNYKYSIKVYLKIKYYGYIIDTKSNEIIKGVKDEKIVNTYMLNLVKYKNNYECPNCYAPLKNNSTVCEYCKTKISQNTNDWLIAEKEKVKEN